MRRSKSIETLLPILYLKGISTGDFSEALPALLGKYTAGLSASAIRRLKDGWLDEHTSVSLFDRRKRQAGVCFTFGGGGYGADDFGKAPYKELTKLIFTTAR